MYPYIDMIMEMLLVLVSLGNGTDDNSTISGCDYYGNGNLRLDCIEEDPVSGGLNSTNSTEILEYVENNIIKDLDDGYCPPDYYGPGPLDDLLDRWCEPESDCPIIDGLGRSQDLVYRQYCDKSLEPDRELNDNDNSESHPDQ